MRLKNDDRSDGMPINLKALKFPSIDDLSLEYRDERDMFRFILENHHDPVFLLKIGDNFEVSSFLDFNQYFCEHSGYTREELFSTESNGYFCS